jgi:hypothetical protein
MYYVLLWNLLNWLPYHALKVSLMQYHVNPYTDFFQTSHVALPWIIYSPYISRFCGDRLKTKTLQSPAACSNSTEWERDPSTIYISICHKKVSQIN